MKLKEKNTIKDPNLLENLDKIAKDCGTDKSSLIHNYCVKYEKYLNFNRLDSIKILEIGVFDGKSLNMWKRFYPNSTVVGVDIMERCKEYEKTEQNLFIEIGSQDNINFLNSIIKKYGEFDLIIDDGSHQQNHMIFSFSILFPFLKKGGTYIVEDTCCSYWEDFGGSLEGKNTSVNYFKNLVDHVNFYGIKQNSFYPDYARREDYLTPQINRENPNIRTDIESINFLNSIIIINKK